MPLSEFEILKNQNKTIAFIYPVDDLFVYAVKICRKNESFCVGKADKPELFASIEEAKKVCRTHHAEEAYLALSNTDQEFDGDIFAPCNPLSRIDYQKIPL